MEERTFDLTLVHHLARSRLRRKRLGAKLGPRRPENAPFRPEDRRTRRWRAKPRTIPLVNTKPKAVILCQNPDEQKTKSRPKHWRTRADQRKSGGSVAADPSGPGQAYTQQLAKQTQMSLHHLLFDAGVLWSSPRTRAYPGPGHTRALRLAT